MNRSNRTYEAHFPQYGFGDYQHVSGGYTRKYPKTLYTPPLAVWYPKQVLDAQKVEYGPEWYNPLNNPHSIIHHPIAATSSGRVVRFPAPNELEKAWSDNMLADSMRMFVKPDSTLTGTATSAATFPQQLSGVFYQPYNNTSMQWRP